MTVMSPFDGSGGWQLGARAAGIAPVIGIEVDRDACLTARAAGFHTVQADVRTFSLDHLAGRVTGLIASPPCQLFSRAGKREGIAHLRAILAHVRRCPTTWHPWEGEHEVGLVLEPLRWALTLRPEWVACEQVPDVLPVWRAVASVLDGLGYSTWAGKLWSHRYGTPQKRQRAILLASTARHVEPPVPTHADGPRAVQRMDGTVERPWVSMAAALGWDVDDEMHQWRGAGMVERYGDRPGRTATEPAFIVTGPGQGGGSSTKLRHVVATGNKRPDRSGGEPAPTVFGHGLNGANGNEPGRSRNDGAVPLTLEELAVLQDFPPGYPFRGNKSSVSRQIGNAIPSNLAEACLRAVAG